MYPRYAAACVIIRQNRRLTDSDLLLCPTIYRDSSLDLLYNPPHTWYATSKPVARHLHTHACNVPRVFNVKTGRIRRLLSARSVRGIGHCSMSPG